MLFEGLAGRNHCTPDFSDSDQLRRAYGNYEQVVVFEKVTVSEAKDSIFFIIVSNRKVVDADLRRSIPSRKEYCKIQVYPLGRGIPE